MTPTKYICSECGAAGVRLYRKYSSSHVALRCRRCTIRHEGSDAATRTASECNIGWSVAAVPTDEECSEWWGYTSVPQDRCDWWYQLPCERPEVGT